MAGGDRLGMQSEYLGQGGANSRQTGQAPLIFTEMTDGANFVAAAHSRRWIWDQYCASLRPLTRKGPYLKGRPMATCTYVDHLAGRPPRPSTHK
jgi:hypothetical protein